MIHWLLLLFPSVFGDVFENCTRLGKKWRSPFKKVVTNKDFFKKYSCPLESRAEFAACYGKSESGFTSLNYPYSLSQEDDKSLLYIVESFIFSVAKIWDELIECADAVGCGTYEHVEKIDGIISFVFKSANLKCKVLGKKLKQLQSTSSKGGKTHLKHLWIL